MFFRPSFRQHWRTMLRITPYVKQKAEAFSLEALAHILSLPTSNHEELRNLAICVLQCFTSLRAEDVHGLTMGMIEMRAATKQTPRSITMILNQTKNDRAGTGPVAGRTFILPCTCMQQLEKDDKAAFARKLKNNPLTLCVEACPYAVVSRYLAECPVSIAGSAAGTNNQLPFARALTSRGKPRTLTSNILGINEIRAATPSVNIRLPEDLRLERATGHTGRHTLATLAMNNGGDQIITAAATKHRDPQSLQGYCQGNDGLLMGAALQVANALPRDLYRSASAGVVVPDLNKTSTEINTLTTSSASTSSQLMEKRFVATTTSNVLGQRRAFVDPSSSSSSECEYENVAPPVIQQAAQENGPAKKKNKKSSSNVININISL